MDCRLDRRLNLTYKTVQEVNLHNESKTMSVGKPMAANIHYSTQFSRTMGLDWSHRVRYQNPEYLYVT
jgi:hypothetical protein